jgi:iron-sulfur cluster assembly accessory protein
MSITLTDQAISKIKRLKNLDKNSGSKNLRIYIESGGCSGFLYGFRWDKAHKTDNVEPYDGFDLLIDPNSLKLMDGAVVDYKEGLGAQGFAIQNPNAQSSCGCGNSFSC